MSKENLEKQLEKQNAFKERKRKEAEEEKKEKQRRREEEERERIEKWEEEGSDEFIEKTFPKKIAENLQTLSIRVSKGHTFKSLYLTGHVGSGKTLYAAELALRMKDHYYRNDEKFTVEFIKVPKLLGMIRETFRTSPTENCSTERQVIRYYSTCDLLILDDLGVEKQSGWVLQTLYTIIDDRNNNYKLTYITSNLSLNEMFSAIDDGGRIPSRIYEMCEVVDFGPKDLRVKDKNKKENK